MSELTTAAGLMLERTDRETVLVMPWRRNAKSFQAARIPMVVAAGGITLGGGIMFTQLAIGMLIALPALLCLLYGARMLLTRSLARVGRDHVTFKEHIGLFARTRRRRRANVRLFNVHRLQEGKDKDAMPNGVIEVIAGGALPLWFAVGYPYDDVLRLARQLAQECVAAVAEIPDDGSPPIKIMPFFWSAANEDEDDDLRTQPAGSRIVVDTSAEGLTVVRIPPPSRARVLATMALEFVAFWYLFAEDLPAVMQAVAVAVMLLFNGAMYWLIRSRSKVLALSDTTLSYLQTGGLLASKEQHWQRRDLLAIRTGLDGSGEGSALRLIFRDEHWEALLEGLSNAELQWLATLLRDTLGVPADERGAAAAAPTQAAPLVNSTGPC